VRKLLDVKVRRGHTVDEWVSSSEQLTDAGRADFAQRQEERRRLAQHAPEPEANVTPILPVVRKGRRP
jgi:hypothetical protein